MKVSQKIPHVPQLWPKLKQVLSDCKILDGLKLAHNLTLNINRMEGFQIWHFAVVKDVLLRCHRNEWGRHLVTKRWPFLEHSVILRQGLGAAGSFITNSEWINARKCLSFWFDRTDGRKINEGDDKEVLTVQLEPVHCKKKKTIKNIYK